VTKPRDSHTLLFAVSMVMIGLNLRIPLGTVPALLPDIERDLGLRATDYGALTALTIVAMGLSAPLGPVLGRRLGAVRALSVMLLILGAGSLFRLFAISTPILFACGILAGIGMGGTSAIIPGLIARIAPRRAERILGLYSASMALGLGLAAAVVHPLAALLGGWHSALAIWGAVAAAVGLLWWLVSSRMPDWFPSTAAPATPLPAHIPLRSASAWLVTLAVGATMCVGMTCVAWLIPMSVNRGASDEDAAKLLLLFQVVQLFTMVGLPLLADRSTDRRPMLALCQLAMFAGLFVLVAGSLETTVAGIVLVAIGIGGATPLGLILIADVGGTALGAARIGGLAFLFSFLLGAVAPGLVGLLLDLTGSYTAGLLATATPVILALALCHRLHPSRTL
jgi:MFS transporter, CP family, cyanate transporter